MNSDGAAQRILQEVASAAHDWKDVHDILHQHAEVYFAMKPRDREQLNAQIRDVMRERML
jgi:hypothetical protein